jgi:hypothetical protein
VQRSLEDRRRERRFLVIAPDVAIVVPPGGTARISDSTPLSVVVVL